MDLKYMNYILRVEIFQMSDFGMFYVKICVLSLYSGNIFLKKVFLMIGAVGDP